MARESGHPVKPCPYCRASINRDARKCRYCNEYLTWRRRFRLSLDVITGLVALTSVSGLVVPIIWDAVVGPTPADLEITAVTPEAGELVTVTIENTGDEPGSLEHAFLELSVDWPEDIDDRMIDGKYQGLRADRECPDCDEGVLVFYKVPPDTKPLIRGKEVDVFRFVTLERYEALTQASRHQPAQGFDVRLLECILRSAEASEQITMPVTRSAVQCPSSDVRCSFYVKSSKEEFATPTKCGYFGHQIRKNVIERGHAVFYKAKT